jgi:hypothetical protein
MFRIVLVLGAVGVVMLAWTLVLGLLGPGMPGEGGRSPLHLQIGFGSTVATVVFHLSAMAILVVLDRRVRRVEVRGLGDDLPGHRLGSRSIRNVRRASPIAWTAVALLGIAALTGLAADADGSGSGWATFGRLATTSVALGFNLVAFGIGAVSILAQRRLFLEACRLADPEADPPLHLPATPEGPEMARIPDRSGTGGKAEDG